MKEHIVSILLLSNAYVDEISSFLIKSGYKVSPGYADKTSTRQNDNVPAVLLNLVVVSDKTKQSTYDSIVAYLAKRSINYYYMSVIELAGEGGSFGLGSIKGTHKKVNAPNKNNVLIFPIKNNDKPIDVMDDEEAKKLAQKQLEQKENQPKPDKELQ